MSVALDVEWAKHGDAPLAHRAMYVHKAFGQINRRAAYLLMARAGLPAGMIHAYAAFLESATTRHTLTGESEMLCHARAAFLKDARSA